MMMHALSQASEQRKRRRTIYLTITLVLLFAVGNEFYKASRSMKYYRYHNQDRPRFATLSDFELHVHLSADVRPVTSRYATPAYSDDSGSPSRVSDADSFIVLPVRTPNNVPNEHGPLDGETKESDSDDSPPDRSKVEREQRNLRFAYESNDEMNARVDRFPSVQERVKLYMSNWYTPPCRDNDGARVAYDYTPYNQTLNYLTLREIVLTKEQPEPRLFRVNSLFYGSSRSGSFDQVHFMDRDAMMECDHRYCKDMVDFMLPSLDRVFSRASTAAPPILYQFGDDNRTKARRAPPPLQSSSRDAFQTAKTDRYPNMPVLKKIRKSIRARELQRLTDKECYHTNERIIPQQYHLEPIVFKLKTQRHYGRIYDIADADVPWNNKRNMAVFRGELNGNYPVNYVVSGAIRKHSVHQRCRLLERCWLVYQHARKPSPLVDAKLTLPFVRDNSKQLPRFLDRRPDGTTDDENDSDENEEHENAVDLYDESVSLEDMLQYKALIMLEGNDVSSGLKWALFSNSVVLMPEPTLTSWAMEERLEPWVHYIPINVYNDGLDSTSSRTDVEEKMQWILDHDDEAQRIARAGKLWIADLVLHPHVARDESAIFDEMVRRYAAHFVRDKQVSNET